LDHRDRHVLIDCGLFQGYKQLRLHNWDPFQLPVRDLDAIVLTHAHLDHSGYLPVLVRNGYRGPIYATAATCELVKILLLDSGRLQEEEAGSPTAMVFPGMRRRCRCTPNRTPSRH
jgi:metallo-beta-lactamase family protein